MSRRTYVTVKVWCDFEGCDERLLVTPENMQEDGLPEELARLGWGVRVIGSRQKGDSTMELTVHDLCPSCKDKEHPCTKQSELSATSPSD